jgi:dipeptide/tripeptide permease
MTNYKKSMIIIVIIVAIIILVNINEMSIITLNIIILPDITIFREIGGIIKYHRKRASRAGSREALVVP